MAEADRSLRLGIKAKDVTTGLTGILVYRLEHLDGHIEYGIQPESKGGDSKRPSYVSEHYLEYVSEGVNLDRSIVKSFGFSVNHKRQM